MSFSEFLSKAISRKTEIRDEALERAEAADDASKASQEINVARTAHNKAKGLSRLNGEKMEAAGFQTGRDIEFYNTHKSRKMRDLCENLAAGKLSKGAECMTLVPWIIRAVKSGDNFISRAALESARSEKGKSLYEDNYRTFWKPFCDQGAMIAKTDGRMIVGYSIDPNAAIIRRIMSTFG
jgi:hypothetical protein